MVVRDFDIGWFFRLPVEADAILIMDPNSALPLAVADQGLQSVILKREAAGNAVPDKSFLIGPASGLLALPAHFGHDRAFGDVSDDTTVQSRSLRHEEAQDYEE